MCLVDGLKLPPPKVSSRLLARFGWKPGDATSVFVFHYMILPDAALGEHHREHLAPSTEALTRGSFGEIVVAIPPWLLRRVSDQFEDPFGAGDDHAMTDHDVRSFGVRGHC